MLRRLANVFLVMLGVLAVATIGFAAGGAALVAGGIWLLAGGRSKPKPAAPAARLVVHPYIGPSSAGVTGAF